MLRIHQFGLRIQHSHKIKLSSGRAIPYLTRLIKSITATGIMRRTRLFGHPMQLFGRATTRQIYYRLLMLRMPMHSAAHRATGIMHQTLHLVHRIWDTGRATTRQIYYRLLMLRMPMHSATHRATGIMHQTLHSVHRIWDTGRATISVCIRIPSTCIPHSVIMHHQIL